MLFLKATPAGIDSNIQLFQKKLFYDLSAKWDIGNLEFDCYGRAYRNVREGRYIPEVYVGGNEYKEVFFDDSLTVQSFFGVAEQEGYANAVKAQVFLVFMVNLKSLKPALAHRGDEEVRVDAEKVAVSNPYGFRLNGIYTGLERVFQEYQAFAGSTLKDCDMHPFHCFRLNFDMNYSIFNC